jgi:hypothetical protein
VRVLFRGRHGEGIVVRDWEETSIQRLAEVTIIGADGVVDGHEICTGWKGTFDLNLMKGTAHRGEDMTSTQHGGSKSHKVRDGVISIADEFM